MNSQSVAFGIQNSPGSQDQGVQITRAACEQVQKLKETEGNGDLKLRVYITGGGCSGFQYGFKLDDKISADDSVFKEGDVAIVVDAMSVRYLEGSTVDFESSLEGDKFFVYNPNAATTCGCGSSFSV